MMNKNGSLENQFNRMADAPAGGSGAGRPARVKRSMIVEYANIEKEYADDPAEGEELKQRMEKMMAAIDLNPHSFDAIREFGTAPISELGKIAEATMRAQTKYDDTLKTMNISMDNVNKSFSLDRVAELKSGVKKMAEAAAEAAKAGTKGVFKMGKGFFDAISGAKRKRTEEEAHVEEMIDSLPDMYARMTKMLQKLQDVEDNIGVIVNDVMTSGQARVKMVRELREYLGASSEVLRRYDEIYIPEAREDFEHDNDPEKEVVLTAIMDARDNFVRQRNILEGSHALGMAAAEKLRMLIKMLEMQRQIIQQFSTIRKSEWMALLNDAGYTASLLKTQSMITKSDKMGDEVHDMALDMQDKAGEMMLESEGRGTVDPKKILDGLERMQKMLERAEEVKQQRAIEAEAMRVQLREGSQRLLESAEKLKNGRILESDEAAKSREAERVKEAPVSNDNQQAAPDAAAADTPPRKNGTGPTQKP